MGRNFCHKIISSLQGAVLFGAPFCAIYAVLYMDPAKGAALGALSGILYGLGTFAYGISQDREGKEFYGRIAEKEKILYYAPANMFVSRNVSVSGRLCLTVDAGTAGWLSGLIEKSAAIATNPNEGKGAGAFSASWFRAMPEDECIVLVRGMPACKGLKYPPRRHPEWGLARKLRKEGPYALTEGKKRRFSPVEWGAEEGTEGKPEESLGQG